MRNKKYVIIGMVVGLIIGFLVAVLIMISFTGVFVTVPKPEIKEGEFDFVLTYEVDGERKKIEGTYVCKFKGVSRNLDGVGRKWIGYIENHDDFTCYELKKTDNGVIKVELDINSQFFMADPFYKINANTDDPKPEPYLYITSGDPTIEDPENEFAFNLYEADDVKIISFEYDEPIENIYK